MAIVGRRWGLRALCRIAGWVCKGPGGISRSALGKRSVCNFGLLGEYGKNSQDVRMAVAGESQSSRLHVLENVTRGLTRDAAMRIGMSGCKREQGEQT